MIGYVLFGFVLGLVAGFFIISLLAWNMQESGKFFVKDGKNYKPFKSPFAGD